MARGENPNSINRGLPAGVFHLEGRKGCFPLSICRDQNKCCGLWNGNMLLGVTEYRVEPSGFYVFKP